MRSALFGPITLEAREVGALAETAIVTQYIHSPVFRELAFANWARGEVDVVRINPATQKPFWALDVKWSERATSASAEWAPLIDFCKQHSLTTAYMTSRTIDDRRQRGKITCVTRPTAVFAYLVGKLAATPGNLLSRYGLPGPEMVLGNFESAEISEDSWD